MKHSFKIIAILLIMFFVTQLIGLFVISRYAPTPILDEQGQPTNKTTHNLPYGMEPPEDITPSSTLISIVFAIAFAAFLMFLLMKYKIEIVFKLWFFVVVALSIGITLNAIIIKLPFSYLIAIAVSLPLAFFKIFKRGIILHNMTELVIYPGIAAIFVPILNIWSVVLLLILISIYDMYAVWHSGFMQKMAQYQIQTLKVFTGFFVPYLSKEKKKKMQKLSKSKAKNKKINVSVAILGGGDIVFPIILAGVVLNQLGLYSALLISIGATLALAGLFYLSEKGKFYPAMPFITTGAFVGLALAYIL